MPTPPQRSEPPFMDALIDVPKDLRAKFAGLVSFRWLEWFLDWTTRIDDSPEQVQEVSLTGQVAAIAATPIPTEALATGMYRVTVYARITTPASGSSSLTITIGFTDGAVPQSFAFAAIAGNLTTSWQSETTTIHIDGATPITYAAAYTSVGTPMQYRLDVLLEKL